MPFNINLAALLGRGVGTGMPQTGNTGSQPFGVNQPLMNIGGGMQNPMQGMGMQNIQQRMSESPRMNYGQSLNSNPVRLGSTMNTNAYRKGFVR